MANKNTARRLLTAEHHRMILVLHSQGKSDADISTWLRDQHRINMSRVAVNRLRRQLEGAAPPVNTRPGPWQRQPVQRSRRSIRPADRSSTD